MLGEAGHHGVVKSTAQSVGNFGVREFQLALLDRMHHLTPELSEAAMCSLGATQAEATEAEERRLKMGAYRVYGRLTRPADWNVADYAAVLGDPISEEPRDLGRLVRWELPCGRTCSSKFWRLRTGAHGMTNSRGERMRRYPRSRRWPI
jgi:hypothetical protein